MNEDLDNLQYSNIWDYNYANFFKETQYNNWTLSDEERRQFIDVINENAAVG